MAGKDDNDLVKGLQANDPSYPKILVDRYSGRLLRIAISLGLSREDGCEVVNDSLYKAIKNIHNFDTSRGNRFRSWLVRITINTAKDKHKNIKHLNIFQSIEERAERGNHDVDMMLERQNSEDSEMGGLSQKILFQALTTLSEADQDILRLCVCGFQLREIAKIMGKTPGSVKTAHHRAKKRLQHKYIELLEAQTDRSKIVALKEFIGIEADNEKRQA